MSLEKCVSCNSSAECETSIRVAAVLVSAHVSICQLHYDYGGSVEESFGDLDDIESIQLARGKAKNELRSQSCMYSDGEIDILIDKAINEFSQEASD